MSEKRAEPWFLYEVMPGPTFVPATKEVVLHNILLLPDIEVQAFVMSLLHERAKRQP